MTGRQTGRYVDVATAATLAVLGALVAVDSLDLGLVGQFGPGPGLLPMLLGLGLVVAGALLGARAIIRGGQPKELDLPDRTGLWHVGLVIGALVATSLTFESLGFPLTVASLTFLTVTVIARRRLLGAAVIAIAVAALGYGTFNLLLKVPLPTGPLPLPVG